MRTTELTKGVCLKCNQEKPEAEFYLPARDGHARRRMQVCTECETNNGAPDNEPRPRRMLSEKQVLEIVPVGRSTLWRMEKAGKFPRGVFVSPNRKFWYENEIAAWQEALDEFDPRRKRSKGRRRRVSPGPS